MQLLGHDGPPSGIFKENLLTGDPLQRCPVRTLQLADESMPIIAREVDRYFDTFYPAYVDGHLLVKGGVADQPARYMELIDEIRTMDHKVQRRAVELAKETEE